MFVGWGALTARTAESDWLRLIAIHGPRTERKLPRPTWWTVFKRQTYIIVASGDQLRRASDRHPPPNRQLPPTTIGNVNDWFHRESRTSGRERRRGAWADANRRSPRGSRGGRLRPSAPRRSLAVPKRTSGPRASIKRLKFVHPRALHTGPHKPWCKKTKERRLFRSKLQGVAKFKPPNSKIKT